MAQGSVKKNATPGPGKANKTAKKNAIIKPKKRGKSTGDKLQKKLSSGMVAKTEKLLAERAGHLELLGKSKKAETKKKAAEETKQKGGSRKFG